MNSFLISLPAILGIVAFVIYLLLRKSVAQDPVIKSILEKIRYKDPDFFHQYEASDFKHKEELLRKNEQLRNKLSVSELKLFDKSLRNQYRTNIFVYSLCGFLLLIGIGLFIYQSSQPQPLTINNIQIQNTDSTSRNLMVDLDPLTISWTSKGREEVLFVVLENVETGQQSKKKRVLSSQGTVTFTSDQYDNYDKILSNRIPLMFNRIRAIIYGDKESFSSKEFEIKVGVRLFCLGVKPDKILLFAAIDNVTIDNYHFLPRLALFRKKSVDQTVYFEGDRYPSRFEFTVPHPEDINLQHIVLTYANPQDDRIVRTEIDLSEFSARK